MLIDFHSHAYRVKIPFAAKFCTLPELLKEQDRLGIDMSVIMPVVSPEIYIPQNTEDIIDMAREYPDSHSRGNRQQKPPSPRARRIKR